MANHSFSVTTVKQTSTSYVVNVTPESSTSNRISLVEGDTITFTWTSAAGGAPSQLNFGGFSTNTFTNASDVSLSSTGTSFTKTVKTGGTLPNTDSCRVSTTGSGFKYWYLNRVSSVDTTPDAFDLGSNVVAANPQQTYYSDTITVSGVNTNVTASANNGGLVKKNNGNFVSSATVTNGDKIVVALTANNAYNSTKTTTLTVGTTTDSWSVITGPDPSAGQLIYLGINSGTIKLTDIADLFGQGQYAPMAIPLSDYLKTPGGERVPNISANSSIPTTLPLKLTDFYGSATSFYIAVPPNNQYIDYDTTASGGNFNVEWVIDDNWRLGFHREIMQNCEFKYSHVETGSSRGVTPYSEAGYTNWSDLNHTFQLAVTVPTYVERRYTGIITVYARHKKDTSKVVSATAHYMMDFYGP